MTTWLETEGSPQPPGATWLEKEKSYNFSLYSRHATGVTLLLYTARDLVNPVLRVPLNHLTHKSGSAWHCRLAAEKVANACYYAYSVEGPHNPSGNERGWMSTLLRRNELSLSNEMDVPPLLSRMSEHYAAARYSHCAAN